jgi:hypothetical protein
MLDRISIKEQKNLVTFVKEPHGSPKKIKLSN